MGDEVQSAGTGAPSRRDGAFPEHSVLSVLGMLAFSVLALLFFRWATAEPGHVVQSWQFTSSVESGAPWEFPAIRVERDRAGWRYTLEKAAPGPQMRGNFPAAAVKTVRVRATLTRAADGAPVPLVLELYWARDTEIAAAGSGWPFSTDRGLTLVERDRHRPNEYVAALYTHAQWSDTIGGLMIGVKPPADANQTYKLTISSIEFIE